ncbi:hypothetical protein Aca07nite_31180 [Actinoplanes capillaceus]|uniref:Excreted virulence factor EspC, type VII ESX diderm n=1 Tax=Actinoplanes campanulatus TaxID=113559 RepID=A0ABQ3WHX7_9ACTN|nr:hypothetical protein [Actinoplanes capillaceus]GID45843.1 hypothetical protein Aca07nite_31180 [Actinoplanes capillaceus]
MGDVPTADELRAALEDLDTDTVFWFKSADIVATAAQTAQTYTLGGFEFGVAADLVGVPEKYQDMLDFVKTSLNAGAVELEKLAVALRDARDMIEGADRESATSIGEVGGTGAAIGGAASSVIRDLRGR